MNIHDSSIATPKVTTGALSGSRKVYARPDAAPDLRVPVREIPLTEAGAPPVPVYDPSGPYTDPDVTIDVEQGLARTRVEWVRARDLGLHIISGYFSCGTIGSNQVGIGGITPKP